MRGEEITLEEIGVVAQPDRTAAVYPSVELNHNVPMTYPQQITDAVLGVLRSGQR